MRSSRWWLLRLVVLLVVGLAGPALAQGPGKGETVRIQAYPGTVGNVFMQVAQANGFCARRGITCEMTSIPSGPAGIQALVAGSIDVAYAGLESVILANDKGADLVAISGHLRNNPFTVSVRPDVPLPNLARGYPAVLHDLKGRKIGVPARGAPGEQHFALMARVAGLRREDITYVAVGSAATAYGALLSRQVDAVMSFEPVRTMCRIEKTCVNAVDLMANEGPPVLTSMNGAVAPLIVRKALLTRSPHVVDAVVAAAQDAQAWVRDARNLDALLAIYRPLIKITDGPNSDQILRAWLQSLTGEYDVRIDRSAARRIVDYTVETGQIRQPPPLDSILWPRAP